jgi:uncharacterized protein YbcC (UPF0753/DUF2309 family)
VIVFTDTTAGVAASLLRVKNAFPATRVSDKDRATPAGYFSFAYSALASFRIKDWKLTLGQFHVKRVDLVATHIADEERRAGRSNTAPSDPVSVEIF